MEQFDVVVIGSGPAGEGAAMTAAKHHKTVAVIERYFEVGGGTTHWGTIPSKALRHAAKILHDVRRNPLLREVSDASSLTYPQLLSSANKVIDTQVATRHRFYERNRVPIYSGEASFVDPHTLEVQPANAKPIRLSGKHIVIAAGSRPYHPPEVDFTHERICDSDTILRYGQHPFAVTIYGAGVIGCEYASIFVNLGVK
jgi:NAD(P) transhydrogenase